MLEIRVRKRKGKDKGAEWKKDKQLGVCWSKSLSKYSVVCVKKTDSERQSDRKRGTEKSQSFFQPHSNAKPEWMRRNLNLKQP